MTEQEVNKILATFEGLTPNPSDGGKTFGINSQIIDNELYADLWVTPQYTADWNDFHRVWMKYLEMIPNTDKFREMIMEDPDPFRAAHKLAEIVKNSKS